MASDQNPAPLVSPVDDLLGYRLRRASVAMMADLAAGLAPLGLSPVQATILLLIKANPGCRQRDLCDALAIKRTNMTPHIATLMGAGIIERAAVDGRSHALFLTEEGEVHVAKVAEAIDTHEARFEAAMSAQEREALLAALRTVEQVRRGAASSD